VVIRSLGSLGRSTPPVYRLIIKAPWDRGSPSSAPPAPDRMLHEQRLFFLASKAIVLAFSRVYGRSPFTGYSINVIHPTMTAPKYSRTDDGAKIKSHKRRHRLPPPRATPRPPTVATRLHSPAARRSPRVRRRHRPRRHRMPVARDRSDHPGLSWRALNRFYLASPSLSLALKCPAISG